MPYFDKKWTTSENVIVKYATDNNRENWYMAKLPLSKTMTTGEGLSGKFKYYLLSLQDNNTAPQGIAAIAHELYIFENFLKYRDYIYHTLTYICENFNIQFLNSSFTASKENNLAWNLLTRKTDDNGISQLQIPKFNPVTLRDKAEQFLDYPTWLAKKTGKDANNKVVVSNILTLINELHAHLRAIDTQLALDRHENYSIKADILISQEKRENTINQILGKEQYFEANKDNLTNFDNKQYLTVHEFFAASNKVTIEGLKDIRALKLSQSWKSWLSIGAGAAAVSAIGGYIVYNFYPESIPGQAVTSIVQQASKIGSAVKSSAIGTKVGEYAEMAKSSAVGVKVREYAGRAQQEITSAFKTAKEKAAIAREKMWGKQEGLANGTLEVKEALDRDPVTPEKEFPPVEEELPVRARQGLDSETSAPGNRSSRD